MGCLLNAARRGLAEGIMFNFWRVIQHNTTTETLLELVIFCRLEPSFLLNLHQHPQYSVIDRLLSCVKKYFMIILHDWFIKKMNTFLHQMIRLDWTRLEYFSIILILIPDWTSHYLLDTIDQWKYLLFWNQLICWMNIDFWRGDYFHDGCLSFVTI